MTLDDFFGDTQKAWDEMQRQKSEEKKKLEEEERQARIQELQRRREEIDKTSSEQQEKKTQRRSPSPSPILFTDYLRLENITCVAANGTVFSDYPELYVKKDIVRNHNQSFISKTPYQWAVYFEGENLFLPSFAVSCNILAALFKAAVEKGLYGNYMVKDEEARKVLEQYTQLKDKYFITFGYHAQNTIIDYKEAKIIDYPSFVNFGQTEDVNCSKISWTRPFSKNRLKNCLLKDALDDADHRLFVEQLTGLADPSILVELGEYFGKPARLRFPWIGQEGAKYNTKKSPFLGCDQSNLNIHCFDVSAGASPARDVRSSLPGGSS